MNCHTTQMRLWAGTILLTLFPTFSHAQKWDDKVIISQCNEQYLMTFDHEKPIVKNTKKIIYESNSAITVTPETAVFYGEYITLDDVSGRGAKLYKNITPENVFYDDTKACIIRGYIDKKGETCKASFERTFKDPKYFCRVYLLENYFVRNKTLTITIPKQLSNYRIKEMNFKGFGIESSHKTTSEGEVYSYTLHNTDRMKEDKMMPPATNVYP